MAEQDSKQEEFKSKLESSLREQYNRGVLVGSASIAKLVLQKLGDKSIPYSKRIAGIQKICLVPVKALEKEKKKNDS